MGAERNQRRQHPAWSHSKNRAKATGATVRGCAIETAITSQHQRGLWTIAIGPVERDQRGQHTGRGHSEDRAAAARAASRCRAVEIASLPCTSPALE